MSRTILHILIGLLPAALCSPALADSADDGPHSWTPAAQPWARELGSHRVIVEVPEGTTGSVSATLNWRRRDARPSQKAVIVQALHSGKTVPRSTALRIEPESGEVAFLPLAGENRYAVYFLPVKISGGAFPVGEYTPAESNNHQREWLKPADQQEGKLTPAKVVAWEAITAHEAWNEMEVIATASESAKMEAKPFLARLESRQHPIRMFDHLPRCWVETPPPAELPARPAEYLIFQIGVQCADRDLKNVTVNFSALAGPGSSIMEPMRFSCFNTGGTDWEGRTFSKTVTVSAGRVQPFWCGLDVPEDAAPGLYHGNITVRCEGGESVTVPLAVRIEGEVLARHGDDSPASLSKLRWLDSTRAHDDKLPLGYEPLRVGDMAVQCLGRTVFLADGGLPRSIVSHFGAGNTTIDAARNLELLSRPMRFVVEDEAGQSLGLDGGGVVWGKASEASVDWESGFTADGIHLTVKGHMEFDGSFSYQVTATGSRAVRDIRLEVPRTPETTQLSTGLGQEGGLAPDTLDWKWNVAEKHQDSLWLGAVNGGLRLLLKDDRHVRAAINIHYTRRPLHEPVAWSNSGAGGMRYADHTLTAYSGARKLRPDEPLAFYFDLLITPFHTLRTREQFTERYYHTGQIPEDADNYLKKAADAGANTINIHQGNQLNPYINYPFLTAPALADFTRAAHARNQRVKFYYTIRELSNWAPELFALRSLGDEVLLSGKGGGHPWLEEHLSGDYWQAWFEGRVQDASLLTATLSRWNNFYIEGLQWLVDNAGCDGIYLDDISYDRGTMLRARKVLNRAGPRGGRIDLHSWNELNQAAGFANCVNVFMDSLPFVDRMWFGEGHHYAGPSPEHFLVEISGIPFGLMGEMLEGGGNIALGLTFGMTGRLGWGGDPKSVWKLWDDFGASTADFHGWWDTRNPVRAAEDSAVKVSVWTKPGAALIALANFGKTTAQRPRLDIDWKGLGLDPDKVHWFAPSVPGIQSASLPDPGKRPSIGSFRGQVILLSESPPGLESLPDPMSGPVLLDEDFSSAALPGWKRDFSPALSADPFKPDSGLVLISPANLHAFVEKALPEKSAAVRVSVWQDTADIAQQWGPGMALVWPDGTALRVNRRSDAQFSIGVHGQETLAGSIPESAPVEITIAWDAEEFRILAGGPGMGGLEQELATLPRAGLPPGTPDRIRIGKMPNDGGPTDFPQHGPSGFNRFTNLTIRAAPVPAPPEK